MTEHGESTGVSISPASMNMLPFVLSAINNVPPSVPRSPGRLDPLVEVAVIVGIVVLIGWFIVYLVERFKEDRRNRIASRAAYTARQIEELYGPLFSLMHQLSVLNQIQDFLVTAEDEHGGSRLAENQKADVRAFFQKNHFHALHSSIAEVLKDKLHLVHRAEVPESFYLYLRHSLQEREQLRLWEEEQIESSFLEGTPFPQNFYEDIKAGFERSMKTYGESLEELHRV